MTKSAPAERRRGRTADLSDEEALVVIQRSRLGQCQTLQVIETAGFIGANDQIPQPARQMRTRGGEHHPSEETRVIGAATADLNGHRTYAVMIAVTVLRSITCW